MKPSAPLFIKDNLPYKRCHCLPNCCDQFLRFGQNCLADVRNDERIFAFDLKRIFLLAMAGWNDLNGLDMTDMHSPASIAEIIIEEFNHMTIKSHNRLGNRTSGELKLNHEGLLVRPVKN